MSLTAPKFLLAADLFPLCQALRLLGFDSLSAGNLSLHAALHHAIEERRIWVHTHAEDLQLQYGIRHFLVSTDETVEQLRELDKALDLHTLAEPFTRCLKCNERLQELPRSQAQSRVPEAVFTLYLTFFTCPACGRVYWPGSHWQRMKQRLEDWGW